MQELLSAERQINADALRVRSMTMMSSHQQQLHIDSQDVYPFFPHTIYSYRDCNIQQYCSRECQAAAWDEHKAECAEIVRIQSTPLAILNPRY